MNFRIFPIKADEDGANLNTKIFMILLKKSDKNEGMVKID